MKRIFSLICLMAASATALAQKPILPGADAFDEYLPLLEGKKVCVLSNQTGVLSSGKHILDLFVEKGVNVVFAMSPEHGLRGILDVNDKRTLSVDEQTGIPIRALYNGLGGWIGDDWISGKAMDDFDVLVFDLQDVGCRFYTYNVTMKKMMAACAATGKKMIVLDRPNPIGFYVDGPILDMKYESGVGAMPIPIVHGMTLGELALMINGEGWLPGGAKCDLSVIKCRNYTHASRYVLPVRPSPNLPDMRSVYLYPSMCYFESTAVSLGRGTEKPFQMYGHPNMQGYEFSYTPQITPEAPLARQAGRLCHGVDLRTNPSIEEINAAGINLEYLLDAYRNLNLDTFFFNAFLEKLVGVDYVRQMIYEGRSADEIKARWAADVEAFKNQRRPYLLYAE